MGAPRPPMEYLAKCSQESLEGIELARLAVAANRRKELQQLVDEWVAAEVDARFARVLLEWRRSRTSAQAEPAPLLEARATREARETNQAASKPRQVHRAIPRQLAFAFAASSSLRLAAGTRRLSPRPSRKKPAAARSLSVSSRSLSASSSMRIAAHSEARPHSAAAPCVLSSFTDFAGHHARL